LYRTCVEGLPGRDRRLLTSTLQFMLSVQTPQDLNRWKLIQLIKLLQLMETLSAFPCCEAGRTVGFLHFNLHTPCTLDICTQEDNQIKNFLLDRLPFKSPDITLCITRFNIQKSYIQPSPCIYTLCMDLRTVIISLHRIISRHSFNGMVFITETECLVLYIFRASTLYTQYLTPTCTVFVFVNYCCNMFLTQLLAIFKEVVSFFDMCNLCAHLTDRNSTCMTEIILKIKKLKH
jgi:hypothetical protein